MFRIQINDPCHEDWSKMSPEEQGRFCQSCQKTVVDFRTKSRDEIQAYLASKQKEDSRTCGRFYRHQLDMPKAVEERNLRRFNSRWLSYFAAACMLAFGSTLFTGCTDARGDNMDLESLQALQADDASKAIVDTFDPNQVSGDTTLFLAADPTDKTCSVKGELPPILTEEFDTIPADSVEVIEWEMMGDIAVPEPMPIMGQLEAPIDLEPEDIELQGNVIKEEPEVDESQNVTAPPSIDYGNIMGIMIIDRD